METDRQIQDETSRWLAHWLRQANDVAHSYGYAAIRCPELRFDLTGTDAAQAVVCPWLSYIRINTALLHLHPARFRDEILPHELAHIAADRWLGAGVDDHGYQWRWVMLQLGVPAHPYHNLLTRVKIAD